MAKIEIMRRRRGGWIVWHDAWKTDRRLVSLVYLPDMPEADLQAALDARLVQMVEPQPDDELAALNEQIEARRVELAELDARIVDRLAALAGLVQGVG